ncbi:transcription factor PIF3, partial [Trifolium medium]|nr:transcription factor PIF3 [Trifolium medium]
KGKEAVEKCMEQTVVTSSVCSDNGTYRGSDDTNKKLKRKSLDSEWNNEDSSWTRRYRFEEKPFSKCTIYLKGDEEIKFTSLHNSILSPSTATLLERIIWEVALTVVVVLLRYWQQLKHSANQEISGFRALPML